METTIGWSIDSDLSFEPMRTLGWAIDEIPWRSADADWNQYDAVYINTPWDYPDDPELFIALLESIDASRAILVNDIALVRWTIPKTYLRDLETRGVAIVPSLWYEKFDRDALPGFLDAHQCDWIIIKPVVSSNATNVFLFDDSVSDRVIAELEYVFANRSFVVPEFKLYKAFFLFAICGELN